MYKSCPSQQNLQALRAAQGEVQRVARRCANDYWLDLCSSIQFAADIGNIRVMYDGIKKALGPTQKKSAPLKSSTGETIQDRAEQMERWVEHYSELYSRENIVTKEALSAIECLPMIEELDAEPTIGELKKALNCLSSGKAPGKDGLFPPETVKLCTGYLLTELHVILCLCWRAGQVPQDMRDSNIVSLYKNKGDMSDCNNYRASRFSASWENCLHALL